MEFPNLGSHCEIKDCKLLDFLPFTCDGCRKTYCLEHRSYSGHKCSASPVDVTLPQCPLCSQYLNVKPNEDLNGRVEEHIVKGCPSEPKQATNLHNPCSQKGCKNREVVPLFCKLCLKNYCFSHRLQLDHTCTQTPVNQNNTNKRESNLLAKFGGPTPNLNSKPKTSVNTKGPSTTDKTVPSTLKMNAKGDAKIPENKRFYLEVVYPLSSTIQPKLMFFNQEWSVGKALDVIADAGGVINNNNKPGPEKLCLLSLKTGEILPTSVPLSGLSPHVCSFDAILLEKVELKRTTVC